ncbi:MAG: VCBS repeat-containing protein [Deltaproteobacteria bacterium]|nr:VCBS repeat-containing protein [Deltaproteobacteria bacterium]
MTRWLLSCAVLLVACEEVRLQNRPIDPAPVAKEPPACGNGVIDEGELCDKAIAAGESGACVVRCSPSADACIERTLEGDPDTCSSTCAETAVTKAKDKDSCCPAGKVFSDDDDCPPDPVLCGNGMIDPGETCDTAASGKDLCKSACPASGPCASMAMSGSGCAVKCSVTRKPKKDGDSCCAFPGDSDTDCAPIASPSCAAKPFAAEEAWRWPNPSILIKTTASNSVTPLVAQFTDDNGDGKITAADTPDVLAMIALVGAGGQIAQLVVFSGSDGAIKWTKDLGAYKTSVYTHPAIADIDNDGKPEIIVAEMGNMTQLQLKGLTAFEHDGTFKWSSDPLPDPIPADAVGAISIADLDGDSRVEILLGNRVFDENGKLEWAGAPPDVPAQLGRFSFALELDPARPGLEVLDGPNAYGADGTLLWSYAAIGHGHFAVGDCDKDGEPDIFVANEISAVILDRKGKVKAGPMGAHNVSPVAAGDLDGDGDVEFVVNGQAKLFAYDCALGVAMSSDTIVDVSAGSGPVMFDFDADGKSEIVFADELKLRVMSHDGHELWSTERIHVTALETPTVADVDGDGQAEIVVAQGRLVGAVPMPPGVITYHAGPGTKWAGARPMWNQHVYQPLAIFDDAHLSPDIGEFWKHANVWRGNTTVGAVCP